MITSNEKILSAQSLTASFETTPVNLSEAIGYSFQAVFSGTPNGAFKLQASNDDNGSPTNWSDIASSSVTVSAAGSAMWNNDGAHYQWVRIVYTFTSGTGSCDITACLKG